METLVFTRGEIAARLALGDCIAAVEDAFRMLGRGEAATPVTLGVQADGGSFHIKAGSLAHRGRAYVAIKSNGNFPGNPSRGLPTIQGLLILCDASDGRVLAVMDSMEITLLRTAAATAVAARHLARPLSSLAVMCGCGVQAQAQLRALCEVLPIRQALAYDVNPAAAAAYASQMTNTLKLPIENTDDLAYAISRADVCVTCTTSTEFLVTIEMVQPGTFVAAVGVDSEHKRELAPDLLAASKLVTDLRAQCATIGDLHHAIEAGVMTTEQVYADLADIVAGKMPGRENSDETIVFDSTGIALQDVAAAVAIYEGAAGLPADSALRRVSFAS